MGELASTGQLRVALLRRALFTVPVTVFLGFLAGAVSNSGDGNRWYAMLQKASFQPPAWLFPVAWSVLYVLLGLALAIVLNARGSRLRTRATIFFVVAFALNLTWSPVFFGMHQARLGLVLIAAMLGVALMTTTLFFRVRRTAGLLMLPYIAWLCLAMALNFEIVRLNPDAESLVVAPAGAQIQLRR